MELYNPGKVPWHESQLIYHALAKLGREALSLVSPATPYVCIGFHQDAEQEVDLDYCKAHGIPVFRREVGGGAVYLDGHQLFYQIILKKDIDNIFSNRSSDETYALADSWLSKEHTLVDLGEDEFTVGRLHPMMDFDLRNKRIIQEAKDKETAIILFDLVLGYGANVDPIKEILPIIKEANKIASDISFICSVTGTGQDPQNRNKVIEILEKNDILVMPSNAAAAEIASLIIKEIK